jgi:hypothetical protein
MCHGDMIKKKKHLSSHKQMGDEKEMEGATFRPRLEARQIDGVQSRLKVTSDPDAYIKRVVEGQQAEESKNQAHRDRLAKQEMEECTFK